MGLRYEPYDSDPYASDPWDEAIREMHFAEERAKLFQQAEPWVEQLAHLIFNGGTQEELENAVEELGAIYDVKIRIP